MSKRGKNMNKISKIIVLIITFVLIACMTTSVFADGILDLGDITGNTSGDAAEDTLGDSSEGTDDDAEEVPDLSFTPDEPETTTPEPAPETTTPEPAPEKTETPKPETETPKTGNTSKYEESDIPYAGPAESILMASAFIICAIIGIYTFIKLSAYNNI